MLRALFYTGLMLTLSAGLVGYDFSREAAKPATAELDLQEYFDRMPQRTAALLSSNQDDRARLTNLPQISGATFASSRMGQIREMGGTSGMIGALNRETRAEASKSFWSRVRHKANSSDRVVTDQNGMTNRLADIRARNQP